MKLPLIIAIIQPIWEQAQDLTYGEILQAAAAAAQTADDKIHQIRRAKFAAAGTQPERRSS